MRKINCKKVISKFAIVLILIISGTICIYVYRNEQEYKNLITKANKYMNEGKYDKAIITFEKSLQTKKDSNIETNVEYAKKLNEIDKIYNNGLKLMEGKKYIQAIEQFKKVTKLDKKLYSNSQKKLTECKKIYIEQNIKEANKLVKNNKYDDANKYVNYVLKIDSNNLEAKKLLNNINNLIKKRQENNKIQNEIRINHREKSGKQIENKLPKNNNTLEINSIDRELKCLDTKSLELYYKMKSENPNSDAYGNLIDEKIKIIERKKQLIERKIKLVEK